MKKTARRLAIKRETIRTLPSPTLDRINGGDTPTTGFTTNPSLVGCILLEAAAKVTDKA